MENSGPLHDLVQMQTALDGRLNGKKIGKIFKWQDGRSTDEKNKPYKTRLTPII